MRRATLLARLLVTPPRLQPAAPPFTRAGGRKRLRVRAFARSLATLRALARARAARQRAFALYSFTLTADAACSVRSMFLTTCAVALVS